MCRRPVRRLDLQCFISHVSHSHVFSSLSSSSSSSQFLRTHEQETKAVFEKLHKYIGKNIRRLVEVPSSNDGGGVSTSSSSEESAFVFRLHRNRVYYVRASLMRRATNISRDKLVHLGTAVGRLTHSGKFRLTVGALDLLAQHAKYKVRTEGRGSCPLARSPYLVLSLFRAFMSSLAPRGVVFSCRALKQEPTGERAVLLSFFFFFFQGA